jgi:hypothetical protein
MRPLARRPKQSPSCLSCTYTSDFEIVCKYLFVVPEICGVMLATRSSAATSCSWSLPRSLRIFYSPPRAQCSMLSAQRSALGSAYDTFKNGVSSCSCAPPQLQLCPMCTYAPMHCRTLVMTTATARTIFVSCDRLEHNLVDDLFGSLNALNSRGLYPPCGWPCVGRCRAYIILSYNPDHDLTISQDCTHLLSLQRTTVNPGIRCRALSCSRCDHGLPRLR